MIASEAIGRMMIEDLITDEERFELQRRFGGQYVARRNGEVIVASKSFDVLMDAVENLTCEQRENLIIEYFDPVDVIRV